MRTGRPTILLATSIHQCAGCCAAAINEITRNIAGYGLDADVLVVIRADAEGEGIALRDRFAAPNISEDIAGTTATVFHADRTFPDMYVIHPDGSIGIHVRDIQHNNAVTYEALVRAGIRPLPLRGTVVYTRSIRLAEPRGRKLAEAQSAAFDIHRGLLSFLEPHQNAIYCFNATTGKSAGELAGFDSLKFRFRNAGDDPRGWELMDSLYSPMVLLEGLVRTRSGDTLLITGNMFTGYAAIDSGAGQPHFTMRKEHAIITVSDGIVRSVCLLPSPGTILVGDPLLVGSEQMLSMTVDENWARGRNLARDTVMALGLFNRRTSSVARVATLSGMDSATAGIFNPLAVGSLTWAGDSAAFYLSEGNRALLRLDLRPGHYSVVPVQPAGTLQQLFVAKRLNDTALTDSVSVFDAVADSSTLYLLLDDERGGLRSERMIVQRYDLNGGFRSEGRIRSVDDEVVSAGFAGVGPGGPAILVKWKKHRWSLEKVER
ncbi:MAG TPA: hypothetical protein VHI13_22870 [Candidatus Kapabacteria bacterium]|nr:hypothetical protein [Candidatus Kapabacteria bacterium]